MARLLALSSPRPPPSLAALPPLHPSQPPLLPAVAGVTGKATTTVMMARRPVVPPAPSLSLLALLQAPAPPLAAQLRGPRSLATLAGRPRPHARLERRPRLPCAPTTSRASVSRVAPLQHALLTLLESPLLLAPPTISRSQDTQLPLAAPPSPQLSHHNAELLPQPRPSPQPSQRTMATTITTTTTTVTTMATSQSRLAANLPSARLPAAQLLVLELSHNPHLHPK